MGGREVPIVGSHCVATPSEDEGLAHSVVNSEVCEVVERL
jgi:hypothetical protein